MGPFGFLNPDGWDTFNYDAATSIQYQPAQSGDYALKLKNEEFNGSVVPALLTCYFPNTQKPASVDFYYIGNLAPGDVFSVSVFLYDDQMGLIGDGFSADSAGALNYTAYSVPINYYSSNLPDTTIIIFNLDAATQSNLGGYVILDNITFSDLIDVEEIPFATNITAWPVPANDFLNISFHTNSIEEIFVDFCDISGRVFYKSENLNSFSRDIQDMQINIQPLPPGIYFYRMNSVSKSITRKFIVE
jgi:hypothetical protein